MSGFTVIVGSPDVSEDEFAQAVLDMDEDARDAAVSADREYFIENPDRWFRLRMAHPNEYGDCEYVLVLPLPEIGGRLRIPAGRGHSVPLLMAAPLHAQEAAIRRELAEIVERFPNKILKQFLEPK